MVKFKEARSAPVETEAICAAAIRPQTHIDCEFCPPDTQDFVNGTPRDSETVQSVDESNSWRQERATREAGEVGWQVLAAAPDPVVSR